MELFVEAGRDQGGEEEEGEGGWPLGTEVVQPDEGGGGGLGRRPRERGKASQEEKRARAKAFQLIFAC